MPKLSKKKFRTIFKLAEKQPWIREKSEELLYLLFSECPKDAHRELILELLNRFRYLDHEMFAREMESLGLDIVTDPKLRDDSTMLVAMSAGSSADSGQYILYLLKPALEKHNWRKFKHVNSFSSAFKVYKKSKCHKNLVLVDEFIGSGRTANVRVREIQRQFKGGGITDFTICIKVLVGLRHGMEEVRSKGIDVTAQLELKKGISDFYDPPRDREMIRLMLDLEELLSRSCGHVTLPSLGYGESESRYAREAGNTPNSVFPVFWWPYTHSGKERKRLLVRSMTD